jgi:DNA-binding transcriptional MerR regulator
MGADADIAAGLRIGELSRRAGVSEHVLRAWERRYGLLDPARTRSGHRLYGPEDERRVARMRTLIAEGYAPQTAAQVVLREPAVVPAEAAPAPADLAREILAALERFDGAAAHEAIDRLMATYALDTLLRDVVLPVMRRVGEEWERGTFSVAQEHFATHVVSGRLRALSRGFDRGPGPHALVACVPGERHDLGALCFSLALRERGWRVTWLGADVPVGAIAETTRRIEPDVVVLAAVRPDPLAALAGQTLAELAADYEIVLGGAGAGAAAAGRLGARLLPGDLIAAADAVAA